MNERPSMYRTWREVVTAMAPPILAGLICGLLLALMAIWIFQ